MLKKRYLIISALTIGSVLFGGLFHPNLTQAFQATQESKTIMVLYVCGLHTQPHAASPGTDTWVAFKIYHETTLDHIEWNIINPLGEIVRSGVSHTDKALIDFLIPEDWIEGEYRFHVNYFSVEQGLEAETETIFLVSTNIGNLHVYVFNDMDRDGAKDSNEPFLAHWSILIRNVETSSIDYRWTAEPEARFDGLVAGKYEISEASLGKAKYSCTTYHGKSFQTTVAAGETTVVFIGVHFR